MAAIPRYLCSNAPAKRPAGAPDNAVHGEVELSLPRNVVALRAIAAHKREKQALTKEFFDHCRNASPNHTAFCCQWCTDNGDARIAIDNLIAELSKELGA